MSFAAEDDEEKKPPEKVKPADNPGDDLERATDAFLFVVFPEENVKSLKRPQESKNYK